MRPRTILVVIACLVALLALSAQAQVTVNAGTVAKQSFVSPMTLDVKFNLAHRELWGQGRVAPKDSLSRFVCDGIYIDEFGMEGKGEGKGDSEKLEASIYFHVVAENNNPKRYVDVTVQLFDGDTAISEPQKVTGLKLKDKDVEKERLRITVPVSKLKTDPITTLRMTVAVRAK